MEYTLVSKKLFLFVIVFCLIYLIFSFVNARLQQNNLIICNENDSFTVYVQIDNKDLLIYPGKTKDVLTCIGKYMAFHDRKIDYIIQPKSSFDDNEIKKRYDISEVKYGNHYVIDTITLQLMDGTIYIKSPSLTSLIIMPTADVISVGKSLTSRSVSRIYMPESFKAMMSSVITSVANDVSIYKLQKYEEKRTEI